MRAAYLALAVAALSVAGPAMACDNGPFAIEFVGQTKQLTADARRDLSFLSDMILKTKSDSRSAVRMEITFFTLERSGRKASSNLWHARLGSVERFLRANGVSAKAYRVVSRPYVQRPHLTSASRVQDSHVTARLIAGGC